MFIIQFSGNTWPDDGRNDRNLLPLNRTINDFDVQMTVHRDKFS